MTSVLPTDENSDVEDEENRELGLRSEPDLNKKCQFSPMAK